MKQNIFYYATSELSQDAFICLLVSWFDSKDIKLNTISKSFISELYKSYTKKPLCDIEKIELCPQYKKIDVYFKVICKNEKTIHFIIEDKTWTEPHSNQLSIYEKKIKTSKHYKNGDELIKIFFKTGHITEKDECETKKAGYKIIDTKWIYDFLNTNKCDTAICQCIIYNDYKDFIKETFYNNLYDSSGNKISLIKRKCEDIKHGYVQYDIVKKIKDTLIETNCTEPYIKHIRNGKSWETQWTYINELDDFIFIKLSKRKRKTTKNYEYCLRLVQYQKDKVTSTNMVAKNHRLENYIDIAESITPPTSCLISEKKPRKPRETDIAKVFFDCDDICKTIDEFTKFAGNFKAKV